MKIEELQIGNWVELLCVDKSIIPIKITGIQENILYGESPFGRHWGKIDDIMPIPLTSEVLEKNEFKLVSQDERCKLYEFRNEDEIIVRIAFYEKDNSTTVRIEKYNYERKYYLNDFFNCDIRYIHQLQQALRICGIDKELTIECNVRYRCFNNE